MRAKCWRLWGENVRRRQRKAAGLRGLRPTLQVEVALTGVRTDVIN